MVLVQSKQLALGKVICHAAKHLTSTVNGVLVGTVDGDLISVTDAIPLFHTASVNLAMPTEVALAQISAQLEESSSSSKGGCIVGYYHSDARFIAGDLTPIGRKIADKLASKQPSTVVLILDNKKLASYMGGEAGSGPFELFTRDGAKGWHRSSQQVQVSDGTWSSLLSDVSGVLRRRLHATLADFDDHLDDVTCDYLNPQLQGLGKMALPGQWGDA